MMIPVDIAYTIHQNQHKDLILIAERENMARKAIRGRPLSKRIFQWIGARWSERDLAAQITSVQNRPSNPSCVVLESAGYYESCGR